MGVIMWFYRCSREVLTFHVIVSKDHTKEKKVILPEVLVYYYCCSSGNNDLMMIAMVCVVCVCNGSDCFS